MASQTNNLGTTVFMIFIFSALLGALFYASNDISDRNTRLDNRSIEVLESVGAEYNNSIRTIEYEAGETNLTNGSTFEGVDAFARQYLEDKTEIQQKRSTVNKILLFPSLVLLIFGVEDMTILISFSALIYSVLVFFIGLQIYKAARTGEVD